MDSTIIFHDAIIELLLLAIILIVYYAQLKQIEDKYLPICLLGTYILSKSFITLGHGFYHKYLESKK